jgi:hypothetical protein
MTNNGLEALNSVFKVERTLSVATIMEGTWYKYAKWFDKREMEPLRGIIYRALSVRYMRNVANVRDLRRRWYMRYQITRLKWSASGSIDLKPPSIPSPPYSTLLHSSLVEAAHLICPHTPDDVIFSSYSFS